LQLSRLRARSDADNIAKFFDQAGEHVSRIASDPREANVEAANGKTRTTPGINTGADSQKHAPN
jgi:hypothetical protein